MSFTSTSVMEKAVALPLAPEVVTAGRRERRTTAVWTGKLADCLELTKPRISLMVLVTVSVAALVANWHAPSAVVLLNTLFGTALVAASSSALNQRLERHTDALMPRTKDRPLPAGRLGDREVFVFGVVTLVVGLAWLALLVNPLTALLGALTWFLYVVVYTPLKVVTPLNTVVGAVAGALPTLMGWAAVDGSFSLTQGGGGVRAATLFLIVYLWQFPHFMAIAWIYRQQYATAGLKMSTVVDPSGRRAGAQAVLASLALAPVCLTPVLDYAGRLYFAGALALTAIYFAASVAFCIRRSDSAARLLLRVSLFYLPLLLLLLIFAPFV